MILIDSSVLIDSLRARDTKLRRLFATLPLGVCGAVRSEILCGARNAADRQRLVTFLGSFHSVPTPEAMWDEVGDNLALLRRSGITIPFGDTIIATLAVRAGVELWARDHHFAQVQAVLPGLVLFTEPP